MKVELDASQVEAFIDGIYIAKKAIEFIEKLGVFEEFKNIIAEHPEDLGALFAIVRANEEFTKKEEG